MRDSRGAAVHGRGRAARTRRGGHRAFNAQLGEYAHSLEAFASAGNDPAKFAAERGQEYAKLRSKLVPAEVVVRRERRRVELEPAKVAQILRIREKHFGESYNFYPLQELRELATEVGSADQPLTLEQSARLAALLARGFDWSLAEYRAFVSKCALHGRQELELLAHDLGKPVDSVQAYIEAFGARHCEIAYSGKARGEADFRKVVEGEYRIAMERERKDLIARAARQPEQLNSGQLRREDFAWTAAHDACLLLLVAQHGWGRWLLVHAAMQVGPEFEADYFLRSRSEHEVEQRSLELLRALGGKHLQTQAHFKRRRLDTR